MLNLFLVACVRPLPGDNEAVPTETPAETGSSSQPETYPGPSELDEEGSSTAYPAGESYPAGEESEISSADLLQPAGESETNAEGYPATEGESVEEGEAAEGETAEGEATEEGEAVEDEATEEGEAPEGEAAEDEATEEGEAVEDEATEEGETPEGEAAESSEETQAVESGRTHTVTQGENLYRIGMQYGISWVALAQANGLTNPNSLSAGQVLTIPDADAADTAEVSDSSEALVTEDTAEDPESADTAEAVEADSIETTSGETTYIVQSGDNLYRISLQFGVSMMEIARENGLTDFNQVYAGQELIIPQGDAAESIGEEVMHLVQEGETVFGIAFQYGIAWTKLVEANDIASPYTLEVGEALIIPSGE
jgi:LysM repeat protein